MSTRSAFVHPLAARWAESAWTGETLDDIVRPSDGLEPLVASVAGGLRAAGVGAGAVVSWQLPNGAEAIALFRACWRLGAVAAPIHHLASPAEAGALRSRLGSVVHVGDAASLPEGPPVPPGSVRVDPASVALALGTSGSTGVPKIAFHSHRALVYKARLMTSAHQLGPDDCVLMPAPMAHISGLQNGVLLAASGMRTVPMAKWDATEALSLISRERVTFMIGPPAFFIGLMDAPGFTPSAVASLRQISCGGAGVTPAFVREASEVLGCRVKRTYGSTEAPTVTTSTLDDPPSRAATTDGRPVGLVQIRTIRPTTARGAAGTRPSRTAGSADPADATGTTGTRIPGPTGTGATAAGTSGPVESTDYGEVTAATGTGTSGTIEGTDPTGPTVAGSTGESTAGTAGGADPAEVTGALVDPADGRGTTTAGAGGGPVVGSARTGRGLTGGGGTADLGGVVDAGVGEPGELWVRGPELFVGYDDPAATAAAFTSDGWFRTGDLGVIDAEGWLTIVGRIKDVIIRGGENIAPAEVEAVLEAHPAVRQAAIVGYPDRRLGERACAFVVIDPGAAAGAPFDLAACRTWCEQQGLTRFKWPERVEILDALPLLPAGKPDRPALRARL